MASEDKDYKQSALGQRVNELMDDGYDFGEAVKQAMSEGLKDGGSVGIEILFYSKFAEGGRVGLFMGGDPLTGQALSIYNSMNAYGFDDQAIANALTEQGLYTAPGNGTPDAPDTTPGQTYGLQSGSDNFSPYNPDPNTIKSVRTDPRITAANEADIRNKQLTSMGIKDPFADEISLSGAYYGDMPTDTSNQVGVYQPGIMENIKNKIGGTKIGSMFTGAADKLTNKKIVNA